FSLTPRSSLFSSSRPDAHPDLPSFPTRRSSDLLVIVLETGNEHPRLRRPGGKIDQHDLIAFVRAAADGDNEPTVIVADLSSDVRSEGTRLNSSHVKISYAVFCLKKKTKKDEIRF